MEQNGGLVADVLRRLSRTNIQTERDLAIDDFVQAQSCILQRRPHSKKYLIDLGKRWSFYFTFFVAEWGEGIAFRIVG